MNYLAHDGNFQGNIGEDRRGTAGEGEIINPTAITTILLVQKYMTDMRLGVTNHA